MKNTVDSTSTSITLYGDSSRKLEKICFENSISATAFFNTMIQAVAEGKIRIKDATPTRRRVTADTNAEVIGQLSFTLTDKNGTLL